MHQTFKQQLYCCFPVINILFDRSRYCQTKAYFRIFKFRPQNTWGIQKLQTFGDSHPLLTSSHTRSVRCHNFIFTDQTIDQSRLTYIRHTHDHNTDRTIAYTFSQPLIRDRPGHLLDRSHHLFYALTGAAIYLTDRQTAVFKSLQPFFSLFRISHIDLIQSNDLGFIPQHLDQHRIAAGTWDPRIQHFNHNINQL